MSLRVDAIARRVAELEALAGIDEKQMRRVRALWWLALATFACSDADRARCLDRAAQAAPMDHFRLPITQHPQTN